MTGELEPSGDGGELVPPGELRASYADRDRVAEQLRIAAGDGRLTADELDQRLELALTARTYAELTALTRDLPAAGGMAAPPREVVRIDCRSGSAERTGRWVVPRRMEVRLSSGSARLDFTEAVITQPSLTIDAEVRSGGLTLITKPGITVGLDDVAVRSGSVKDKTQWSPDAPAVLHIQVTGRVGSGSITVRGPRRPRRTFWAWLLRRPRPRPRYPAA
ncbi:MAG TPA: DUF1707 domain-containing protein [Streptosporangiaceae bacterium]|nr:DUF1707 domain-containing protein [Streptosporangiaceae bacterium]